MRFIVEIYRMLILISLAFAIIVSSYTVFEVIQAPELPSGTGALVVVAALTAAIFIIVSLGITATFISMHDRLEELADESRQVRMSLHQGSRAAAHDPAPNG